MPSAKRRVNTVVSDFPQSHLPPDIQQALEALRSRIRKYVLLHGAAIFLALLCGLFWLGLSFDVVHFLIRKLELPWWFRTAFLLVIVGLLTAALVSSILLRMLRGYRFKALALVLERQFPQLGDRLITAVELADQRGPTASGLGGAMLQRTVQDAGERVKSLDLDAVFNRVPLRRWTVIASVLLTSVLVLGVLNTQAMERWFNAYVLLRSDYWEPYRQSSMTVKVLAQPGDRVREFDENGVYKHPRGRDLTVLAEVPEGRRVPEDVYLYYRAEQTRGTNRGHVRMSPQSDRRFRHTLTEVVHPHDLWVTGGDYINRDPFRIEIVDPPRVDQIHLKCVYPEYTGMRDLTGEDGQQVLETQISLPVETEFLLTATANKPLQGVRIQCEHFELSFTNDAAPSRLILHPQTDEGYAESSSSRTLTLDGAVSSRWYSEVRIPGDNDDENQAAYRYLIRVPFALSSSAVERLSELEELGQSPLPLPPDSQLQIYLHDTDDIQSIEPTLLTINGTVDQDPVVETERQGVRELITRMAEVPIAGTLRDDYGLVDAWFGYRLEGDEDYTRVDFADAPRGQSRFVLGDTAGTGVERFLLLGLPDEQRQVEQRFELTVFARDGDNLNGPHTAHGEVYTFQIVTPEALLTSLYDKELNLRRRFEQIRDEVAGVRDDLLLHRQKYEDGLDEEQSHSQDELQQIAVAITACAERNLHLIRKNHTESRSVEVGFVEIRAEMVNNQVDTPTSLQRIDFGVLKPLSGINNADFPGIDQFLGLFRLANEQNSDPRSAIDSAVVAIDDLIAKMENVLAEMEQRKEFNEVVRMLQEILDQQKGLRDRTAEEQERNLFDLLK